MLQPVARTDLGRRRKAAAASHRASSNHHPPVSGSRATHRGRCAWI